MSENGSSVATYPWQQFFYSSFMDVEFRLSFVFLVNCNIG